ncbi:GntR family transcriptional regulator [Roseomonas stagni]|uniref:GntR family transcriptional regulator n=1 Tax=Falsiroseomonas algicola TaxID=2716930 RepID=A0A6M1LFG1_9PROT|nr:GntR family transcriptional regulator [Falsiroseomonas algicola]NGM18917.1 GntR family transcriptional regulator [Falsiroseomonas algicola]
MNALRPDPRPLYAQTEAILTRRIADGVWAPGSMIPPEPDLAAELGVSPGTVRKALGGLERRRLIERRQGRGTFVAAHTSERALFHFFRITALDGQRRAPTSHVLDCATLASSAAEAAPLGLEAGAALHRVKRARLIGGAACILERIWLPEARFPGFALPVGREMTDELYVLYQRDHGVTIARAEERLAAIAAPAEDAALLGLREGAPLLEVARIAFDLQDRPVERRVTLLDTAQHRYVANLD